MASDRPSPSTSDSSSESTLAQAELLRQSLGGYEMEITFSGEVDLHNSKVACKKNPGHNNFIRACDFAVTDLPDGWKDEKIVEYVHRSMMWRAVRLVVSRVSEDRPKGAFLYRYRGRKFRHTATGWIVYVFKMTAADGDSHCLCPACEKSSCPETEWYQVEVRTARHVVHDLKEARQTTVEIGYDDDANRDKVETLFPFNVLGRFDFGEDDMTLKCATHSASVYTAYQNLPKMPPPAKAEATGPQLAVVVSHPHGCCKVVSVGFVQTETSKKNLYGYEDKSFTYDTPTCPGSSGAPIWVVGAVGGYDWFFPHSGHDIGKTNFNKSGPGGVFMPKSSSPLAGSTAGNTTGNTVGDTTGDTAGSTVGDTAGSTIGDTAGSTTGDTAGSTVGDTAGNTTGDTAGSTTGDTAGSTTGDTAGNTTGNTVGDTTGDTAGSTVGDTAGSTTGNTVGDTTGDTAGSTVGDTAGSTTGSTAGSTAAVSESSQKFPPLCQNMLDAEVVLSRVNLVYLKIGNALKEGVESGSISTEEKEELKQRLEVAGEEMDRALKHRDWCNVALAGGDIQQLWRDLGGQAGWEKFSQARDAALGVYRDLASQLLGLSLALNNLANSKEEKTDTVIPEASASNS